MSPRSALAPRKKYIFATHQQFAANFGGLAAADALCTSAAANAHLNGTSWKAWLSTSTTDAIDRIDDVGPWFSNGAGSQLNFNNKANLRTTAVNWLNRDESGQWLGDEGASIHFWTGTLVNGVRGTRTCGDWTQTSGSADTTDRLWAPTTIFCWGQASLVCIEQ